MFNKNQITIKNTLHTRDLSSAEIFNFIKYTKTNEYTSSRLGNKQILNKELAKKALYMYLVDGMGHNKIMSIISEGQSDVGFIVASTLAYYRLSTKKSGELYNSKASRSNYQRLIDELVEMM